MAWGPSAENSISVLSPTLAHLDASSWKIRKCTIKSRYWYVNIVHSFQPHDNSHSQESNKEFISKYLWWRKNQFLHNLIFCEKIFFSPWELMLNMFWNPWLPEVLQDLSVKGCSAADVPCRLDYSVHNLAVLQLMLEHDGTSRTRI